MKKSGFTLVELMVVVAVIGILAAFSMPRFQRAADIKRAAEAPQVLNKIAGAQNAFRLVNGQFLPLDATTENSANWNRLGLNTPQSNIFRYTSARTLGSIGSDGMPNPAPTFTATATLITNLSRVAAGTTATITLNSAGEARATPDQLKSLVKSFVND